MSRKDLDDADPASVAIQDPVSQIDDDIDAAPTKLSEHVKNGGSFYPSSNPPINSDEGQPSPKGCCLVS